MGKREDRIKLVGQINAAAKLYKERLVGRRFMYVFDNRFIEVIYKKENFRHLTGVDTDLSALQFYRDATRGRLAAAQISFNERHPYDLCVRKVTHLAQLANHTANECFMLEGISTKTATFKFGTSDLKFTVCMNRRAGECYDAESLRDEDCVSKSDGVHVVSHVFSAPNSARLYEETCFVDDDVVCGELPVDVMAKLSPRLITDLEQRAGESGGKV